VPWMRPSCARPNTWPHTAKRITVMKPAAVPKTAAKFQNCASGRSSGSAARSSATRSDQSTNPPEDKTRKPSSVAQRVMFA
jgi:hypothetical protein